MTISDLQVQAANHSYLCSDGGETQIGLCGLMNLCVIAWNSQMIFWYSCNARPTIFWNKDINLECKNLPK